MRLPLNSKNDTDIDEEKTAEMTSYAMEHGINYYDTAWGYHGGNSETVMGRILSRYPRDSYYLAAKFPGYDLSNMSNFLDFETWKSREEELIKIEEKYGQEYKRYRQVLCEILEKTIVDFIQEHDSIPLIWLTIGIKEDYSVNEYCYYKTESTKGRVIKIAKHIKHMC